MNRPLVLITILFALGVAFTSFLKISVFYFFITLIISGLFTALALLRGFLSHKHLILFWFFLTGFLYGQSAWYQIRSNSLENFKDFNCLVEGTLESDAIYRNTITSFNLRSSGIYIDNKIYPLNQRIKVRVYGRIKSLSPGEKIIAKGLFTPPPSVRNPGEFSYKEYLLMKNIHAILKVNKPEDIKTIDGHYGSKINLINLRKSFIEIFQKFLEEPKSSLLGGIIFGSSTIPPELEKSFQITGTLHIVAASGSNISVIIIIIIFIGELLKIPYRKSAIICIPIVIFYALLAGGQPSIIRAAIMSVIILSGLIIERESDLLTSLFGAAFLILVLDPLQLFDVSFQLSFSAVLSIIYFTSPLQKFFSFIPSRGLRDCLCVSLAVQLGTAPVSIYYFNQLSIVALIVNLLIFIFTGFTMILGLFMLLSYPVFPLLALLISRVLNIFLDYIIFTVSFFSQLPFAALNLATPSIFSIVLYYILLFLLFNFIQNYSRFKEYLTDKKNLSRLAIGAGLLILILIWYPLLFPPRLEMVFLDVGQGDAIFLKLPDGTSYLIDGGKGGQDDYYDTGKMILVPFLESQGISELTGVFLTHSDNDHLGGLLEIMRRFKVKAVFDGMDFDSSSRLYKEFLFLVNKNGSSYYRLKAGDEIKTKEGVNFKVLNPSIPLASGENHLNENSLVVRISWKNVSCLITGDIEKEGEKRILNSDFNIKSDILKISHHGSNSGTGEEFLSKVSPTAAIISVGSKNNYGHPSPDVLHRLKKSSVSIYGTDYDGAIIVVIDGKNWVIHKMRGGYGDE